MRRALPFVFAALLAALAVPSSRRADSQEAPPLRVEVGLVSLDVAVTDAAGNFQKGLARENFRVREDGAEQALAHFAPATRPVHLALLVEASPAIFLIRDDYFEAAYYLTRGLAHDDQLALLSYAGKPSVEVDFTTDKQEVLRRLHGLAGFGLGMADPNLFDAAFFAADWLRQFNDRKAVLVIGTGFDARSRLAGDELRRFLEGGDVTFFALATGSALRQRPEEKKKRASAKEDPAAAAALAAGESNLRALAELTAGRAYFPESPDELPKIYEEIAARLRHTYSLGYYPANRLRDGAYRKITVELVDETGAPLVRRDAQGKPLALRVFARPGYFAPAR